MSSTIDNINTNITDKINAVIEILKAYSQYDLDGKDNTQLEQFSAQAEELLSAYEFGSIDILKDYYQTSEKPRKQELYVRFMKFIGTENVVGKLKKYYQFCKKLQKHYNVEEAVVDHFSLYDHSVIDTTYNDRITNECPKCKKPFVIEAKTSESICNGCGMSEKMYGVVFEDEQFFYQEGSRTKHGKYDPTKHCKFWVDRIQAKENTEIDEESIIVPIKRCIRRDGIWLERVTYKMIRKYLKEIDKTEYNNHVPLIRKIITGQEPAQLTDYELKLLIMYFSRVIQIFSKTRPNHKSNCPYHPFFIYKIIEQILKKPEDKTRRKDILSAIHLQSRDTLIENDNIWKPICHYIPEFTYIPTDPSRE